MSNDPEQEFFSDGITEDIITDLSKASGLQVLSRNTVFTLKGKAQNLQQVARQLGVQFILEGSVRKAGNRVRVAAQLIEGATDSHVWAERYDRDLADIFALQDELTRTIVDQLKVTLLPEERAAIAEAPTRDVQAYTSYLKGRQFLRSCTRRALLQGRQLFLRAIELDPDYADAYVGVANCECYLKSYHGADIDVSTILETADKALALDPKNAGAYAAKGNAYTVVDAREESEAAFHRALEIDPDSWEALYHFARYYTGIGAFEKAVPLYVRAMEVQPDDYESVAFLHQVLEGLGRVAEANKYAEIALKRAETAQRLNPDNSRPAQLIAGLWSTLGEQKYAKEWIERAFEIDPEDNHIRYNAAGVYARMGDFDKAFDLLEAWAPSVSKNYKLWFANDPDFSSLRAHPRYQTLLRLVAD
jgi:adenylate cyclase